MGIVHFKQVYSEEGDAAACGLDGGGFARGLHQVDCQGCMESPEFQEAVREMRGRKELERVVQEADMESLRGLCFLLWAGLPRSRRAAFMEQLINIGLGPKHSKEQ